MSKSFIANWKYYNFPLFSSAKGLWGQRFSSRIYLSPVVTNWPVTTPPAIALVTTDSRTESWNQQAIRIFAILFCKPIKSTFACCNLFIMFTGTINTNSMFNFISNNTVLCLVAMHRLYIVTGEWHAVTLASHFRVRAPPRAERKLPKVGRRVGTWPTFLSLLYYYE